MEFSNYLNKTHTYGRIATLIAMAIMLGIPAIVCSVYNISISSVMTCSGPEVLMPPTS